MNLAQLLQLNHVIVCGGLQGTLPALLCAAAPVAAGDCDSAVLLRSQELFTALLETFGRLRTVNDLLATVVGVVDALVCGDAADTGADEHACLGGASRAAVLRACQLIVLAPSSLLQLRSVIAVMPSRQLPSTWAVLLGAVDTAWRRVSAQCAAAGDAAPTKRSKRKARGASVAGDAVELLWFVTLVAVEGIRALPVVPDTAASWCDAIGLCVDAVLRPMWLAVEAWLPGVASGRRADCLALGAVLELSSALACMEDVARTGVQRPHSGHVMRVCEEHNSAVAEAIAQYAATVPHDTDADADADADVFSDAGAASAVYCAWHGYQCALLARQSHGVCGDGTAPLVDDRVAAVADAVLTPPPRCAARFHRLRFAVASLSNLSVASRVAHDTALQSYVSWLATAAVSAVDVADGSAGDASQSDAAVVHALMHNAEVLECPRLSRAVVDVSGVALKRAVKQLKKAAKEGVDAAAALAADVAAHASMLSLCSGSKHGSSATAASSAVSTCVAAQRCVAKLLRRLHAADGAAPVVPTASLCKHTLLRLRRAALRLCQAHPEASFALLVTATSSRGCLFSQLAVTPDKLVSSARDDAWVSAMRDVSQVRCCARVCVYVWVILVWRWFLLRALWLAVSAGSGRVGVHSHVAPCAVAQTPRRGRAHASGGRGRARPCVDVRVCAAVDRGGGERRRRLAGCHGHASGGGSAAVLSVRHRSTGRRRGWCGCGSGRRRCACAPPSGCGAAAPQRGAAIPWPRQL